MSGVVIDARSRLPIAGARVMSVGNAGVSPTTTDSKGTFILEFAEGVQEGSTVRIRVERAGYKLEEELQSLSTKVPLQISLVPTNPSTTSHGAGAGSQSTTRASAEPPKATPISIYGLAYDGNYSEGAIVEGIPWTEAYSRVQLFIENLSDQSVNDLNLSISLDGVSIAEMRQAGGVPPHCEASPDEQGVHPGPASLTVVDKDGKTTTIPASTKLISAPAYRIHCPGLFARSAIQFVIACVNASTAAPQPKKTPTILTVNGSYSTGLHSVPIESRRIRLTVPMR
jgi:hypothetical protein